jgi:hypothetical protein
MRRLLRVHFEAAGCLVCDGEGLTAIPLQKRWDVLIIDLDDRSADVLAAIRVCRRFFPGVIVGGYSIRPADTFIQQLCLDRFMEKPFEVQEFVKHLIRACHRSAIHLDVANGDSAL